MNSEKYYTEDNVDVTKNIELGKTFLVYGVDIEAEKEAKEIAKRMSSYSYEIYSKNEFDRKVHVGYGIPK